MQASTEDLARAHAALAILAESPYLGKPGTNNPLEAAALIYRTLVVTAADEGMIVFELTGITKRIVHVFVNSQNDIRVVIP